MNFAAYRGGAAKGCLVDQIADDFTSCAFSTQVAEAATCATPRRKALDELIKGNNKRLDKLTAHGAQPHQDRDAFLDGLYSKENLDELKFPYLADVVELLNTNEYVSARWTASDSGKK